MPGRQELITQQFGGQNFTPTPPTQLGGSFTPGARTRAQVTQFGSQASRFESFRPRVNASISNAVDREGREVGNVASTAVQQRFGDQQTGAVRQTDVLNNALKRAKARVQIRQRGENASRNQQLKDRLTQARSGIRSRGRALQDSAAGQNILAGVDVGIGDARARTRAAQADAFGTVAGAFGASLKNNRDSGRRTFDFGFGDGD